MSHQRNPTYNTYSPSPPPEGRYELVHPAGPSEYSYQDSSTPSVYNEYPQQQQYQQQQQQQGEQHFYYHHQEVGYQQEPNPRQALLPSRPSTPLLQQPLPVQESQQQLQRRQSTVFFGRTPQRHTCQYCGYTGVTHVSYEISAIVWPLVLAMCIVGICFWPFWCSSCLPFLFDNFKNVEHHCNSCGKVVGKKSAT